MKYILVLLILLMTACTSKVPYVEKAPINSCKVEYQSIKLHVINKQKYQNTNLSLMEYNSLLKDDLRLLIIDKVNLININEALKLEIQCLRKFI